ncbi:MAG: DUF1829 domain-containing protein [Chloroflexi bacterium]|nr:DUF1829 domain-containing protein [Chloroflexota bacterium]
MIDEIQTLLDNYVSWLRDKTTLRQVNDWVEITTPYLDRHNDQLQIYAKRSDSSYILTDDGYIIDDLEQSGCRLETPKRQSLLKMTLNGFGVQLNANRLEIPASSDNFALRKHNLLQAMLAVNDLFYMAEPIVQTLFFEDVVSWLELNEIRYTQQVKFTGKSGYDHLFDFVIPKSRSKPERILQAINSPNKNTAEALVFAWIDTKEVRPAESKAYALLNDTDRSVSAGVIEALKSYEVNPVLWSARDAVRLEFAE